MEVLHIKKYKCVPYVSYEKYSIPKKKTLSFRYCVTLNKFSWSSTNFRSFTVFLGKLCVLMSPPFSKVPLWIFGQATIIKVVIMTLSEGQVNNDRIVLDTEGK